ncbi:MAG TPA: hypothetical protein VGZ22_11285 [Isosphaeraceae bacterium]|nr:hypothetical protein [Isosphaeraceae bacterium]
MAWKLRRLVISLFVIAHLCAVVIWIVPFCVIKQRCLPTVMYYMMPLGQWQYWGMFAPDPMRDTVMLDAVVLDAHGLLYRFSFPRETEMGPWKSALHYRHSKYSANYSLKDEFAAHREFGARHVVRSLKLPASAFPVEVELVYQVLKTPPPMGGLTDPMTPPETVPIQTYKFPTLEEVMP